MTNDEKIKAIKKAMAGIHPYAMTQTELEIWEIVWDQKASKQEKAQAKMNSEILEFADDEE